MSRFRIQLLRYLFIVYSAIPCAFSQDMGWGNEIKIPNSQLSLRLCERSDLPFIEQLLQQEGGAEACGVKYLSPEMAEKMSWGYLRARSFKHDYLIFSNAEKKPVGIFQVCFIPNFRPALEDIAEIYRKEVLDLQALDVGFMIDTSCRKKGYASTVLKGFQGYINARRNSYLEDESIGALAASTPPENTAAISVVTKCNFDKRGEEKSDLGRQLYLYKFQ